MVKAPTLPLVRLAPEDALDKLTRLTRLHGLFSGRRTALSIVDLCERLECSRATAKRALRELREESGAPVHYDREFGGYLYRQPEGETRFELPGLWFGPDELAGLVTLRELLARLEPGVLAELLAPLGRRLDALMKRRDLRIGEAARRIRILSQHGRSPGPAFAAVAEAVLTRRRLEFQFHRRDDEQVAARRVSPQRLTRYRGCWYLDAWCHDRQALRTFALERIAAPKLLRNRARSISEEELDAYYAGSYGIFAGEATDVAILRVSPRRARWVADEIWHPRQEGRHLESGDYELRIPFHQPAELLMRHSSIGPGTSRSSHRSGLRREVGRQLREAATVTLRK